MEPDELTDRAVSNLGDIDLENIQTGKLTPDEWASLTHTCAEVDALPLFIDEQAALTLGDIQAKARMLKRQHGIVLLVVDYLQLCAGNPKADKRHHQIEEISRGLKVLAKQLGITVILISQLSRDVERRTSGKAVLADLKESGAIEEDADVVILLSVAFTRASGAKVIEADLAKNRQGRKGSVMLAFDGAYQRWVETVAEDRPLRPASKHYTEDV
jgi:replicative DNA helicase